MSDSDRLLGIFLNDHLSGATVGVELARRSRASNRDDPEFGEPLALLCGEIEADRETLRTVMDGLGVVPDKLKPVLAWAGEKVGRLKPNGRLRGYSPLSRVLELEGLYVGISGKHRLWSLLDQLVAERLPRIDFAALAERAEAQRARVAELQSAAASRL